MSEVMQRRSTVPWQWRSHTAMYLDCIKHGHELRLVASAAGRLDFYCLSCAHLYEYHIKILSLKSCQGKDGPPYLQRAIESVL